MDAASSSDVVSKGRFAALRNVSPGRVSQWISEGKIKPSAMVGEGRNAQIKVSVAVQQLRDALDVGQRTGNGIDTNLDLPLAAPSPAPAAATASAPTPGPAAAPPPASDPIADAIKSEKLDQIRRANRRQAEEEAARSGRFTDAAEASRQMGALATKMMAVMEGSLAELSTAVAARFEVPQRDVLHLLRSEFRKVRAVAAKTFRDVAGKLPAAVEAELPDAD